MACPITSEQWQAYQDTGDPRVAQHLASCALCRAEVETFNCLHNALASLPQVDASGTVKTQMLELQAATQGRALGCDESLDLLEAWREGALNAVQSFLVEDHLLACPSCSAALEQAETLTTVLRTLPVLDAPAVIAERIAQARIPWWQRLLAPAPTWTPRFSMAAGLAASFLLVFGISLFMQRPANTPYVVQVPSVVSPLPPTLSVAPNIAVATVQPTQPSVRKSAKPRPVTAQTQVATVAHRRPMSAVSQPANVDITPVPAPIKTTVKTTVPTSEPPVVAKDPEATPATIIASAGVSDPSVEYTAKDDLVARAMDERMMEIDDSNAAASEMVRLHDVARPRLASFPANN